MGLRNTGAGDAAGPKTLNTRAIGEQRRVCADRAELRRTAVRSGV
jgi:hypothetical protein